MNKRLKKIFLNTFGITAILSVIALPLASCSSTFNKFVDNTIDKGNGELFFKGPKESTLKGDLNTTITNALLSNVGRQEILKSFNNSLSYQIVQLLTKDEKHGKDHQRELNTKVKELDKTYNDKIKSYKQMYGKKAWELKFQQEVLDPLGGTEESWRTNQLNSWASGYLSGLIFKKNYLTLIDTGNGQKQPLTMENLLKTFDNTNNKIKAKFSEKYTIEPTLQDKIFSMFQQIAFDNWLFLESPYVANMSLWKYGTPNGKISEYYTPATDSSTSTDEEGNETTTTNGGSYVYPYFSDKLTSNVTGSTIDKFEAFVKESKTNNNFLIDTNKGGKTQNSYGLKSIPLKYTEDSSTFILVKNSSGFNDLYPEFIAATSYLYEQLINNKPSQNPLNGQTQPTTSDASISKDLNALNENVVSAPQTSPSNKVLDKITQEFVNTSKIGTITNQITLDKSLTQKIINEKGNYASLKNSDLYIVDAFKVSSSQTQLNDFMFIRNQAGVHAVAIDGDDYIKGTSGTTSGTGTNNNLSDVQKRSGDVILYHALKSKIDDTDGFKIDLMNELTTFFTSNNTYLTSLFVQVWNNKNSSEKINIDYEFLGISEQEFPKFMNYIKACIEYDWVSKWYNNYLSFNTKLKDKKVEYSNNYGVKTHNNGLAAPWVYLSENSNPYKYSFTKLASIHLRDVNTPIKSFGDLKYGPWSEITNQQNSINKKTEPKQAIDIINDLISAINPSKLESKFSGFKYSQLILSNNNIINTALLTYTSSDDIGTKIKLNVLSDYLKNSKTLATTGTNSDLKNGVQLGLANYYFGKDFANNANKWNYFSEFANQTTSRGTAKTFNKITLQEFKYWLWRFNYSVINKNEENVMFDYAKLFLSIEYLIKNDFEEFINHLKNKVEIGTSAYIVWSNSYNEMLDKSIYETTTNPTPPPPPPPIESQKIVTIDSLLKADNVKQNLNNSFNSSYFGKPQTTEQKPQQSQEIIKNGGNSGTPNNNLTNNISTNAVYNENPNYYTIVNDKLGFYGLETNISNTLPEVIKSNLFDDPKKEEPNGTGILYGYINREYLIEKVKNITTFADLDSLMTTLSRITKSINFNKVISEKEIQKKKDVLIEIINDNTKFKDEYFKKRIGNVGIHNSTNSTKLPIVDSSNTFVRHGAYVIQLNNNDVSSYENLVSALSVNNNQLAASNDANSRKNANEIIGNLLVQAALDENVQSYALNGFLENNKVTVYDVNLFKLLDSMWVENWKDIND